MSGQFLRPAEVATELSLSRASVYKLIESGKLRATRPTPQSVACHGRKTASALLIARSDLDAFLRERAAPTVTPTGADVATPLRLLSRLIELAPLFVEDDCRALLNLLTRVQGRSTGEDHGAE